MVARVAGSGHVQKVQPSAALRVFGCSKASLIATPGRSELGSGTAVHGAGGAAGEVGECTSCLRQTRGKSAQGSPCDSCAS